ncbi:MAG: undecaprenyl-diphosphate phosphatase, partial [Planctomycetaceae bacterium]|nr:undecaprenyl-diphosphate phosphatase [Planctomycetaceae bacterium]
MPQWLEMLILSIVQGIAEFLPISSSGHLVLLQTAF